MWFVHLLFAFIIGLLLAVIFAGVSRRKEWNLFWMFFLIIFLGSWAGGMWIRPFGPPVYDVYWMPVLFAGVLIALLLVTLLPPPRRESSDTVELVEAGEEASGSDSIVFGFFFWLLITVLIVTIVAGYLV